MLTIIIVSFLLAIYLYPQMPSKMASHWGVNGEVNGFMSKFWGLFLMPIISLGMFLLFFFLPKIDPLRNNIQKFKKHYDNFILLLISFLFYIYLLTIVWNLNFKFDLIRFLSPAFAILFYYVGILVENSKQNWFIGIRTPWTLSNETVWDKTHKLGGKMFKITAIIAILGMLLPEYAIYLILMPVILTVIITAGYSYWVYGKTKTKRIKKIINSS